MDTWNLGWFIAFGLTGLGLFYYWIQLDYGLISQVLFASNMLCMSLMLQKRKEKKEETQGVGFR